jgi:hypothetical protein
LDVTYLDPPDEAGAMPLAAPPASSMGMANV